MPGGTFCPHRPRLALAGASTSAPFGTAVPTATQYRLVAEDVLITGAGPIGIMAAMVARHNGARYVVITDVSEYRLDLARKVGGARAVDAGSNGREHVEQ